MLAESCGVRLAADGTEELVVERNVAQRIDVRPHVAAESDRIGGSASSPEGAVAVGLAQAVEERRVARVMGHTDETGLCQVDRTGPFESGLLDCARQSPTDP